MAEQRLNPTNATAYLYDGLLITQERNASNNTPVVTYTRGLDLISCLTCAGGIGGLLGRTDANGSTYYHADGDGNITGLIDTNQLMVARYTYDAFGRLIGKWGSMADANRYRFSSKEFDTVTGLYYYGFRYYDPTLQRFLNRDPIGEIGGINLYGFVGNNPVNFVDPFGLTTYYSTFPLQFDSGTYGPYTYTVNDGSDAVLPAVPYLTDSQGLVSSDLSFVNSVANLATPQQGDAQAIANVIGQGDNPDAVNDIQDGLNLIAMAGFPEGAAAEELAAANTAKSSLSDLKAALKKAQDKVGKQPKCKPDKGKFGSPQRGTPKKGYRLDPGHPNRPPGDPENGPHINWWDYTEGKRGSGGQSGAIPIPPGQ